MHDVIVGKFSSFETYMWTGGMGAVTGVLSSTGNLPAAAAAIRAWQAEAVFQPMLVGMMAGTVEGIREKVTENINDKNESSSGSDGDPLSGRHGHVDVGEDCEDGYTHWDNGAVTPPGWDGDPCDYIEPGDESSNDSSDDSSASEGTIICTELFRQGFMPKDIYQADDAFGVFVN